MARCPFLRHGKCLISIPRLKSNTCPWFTRLVHPISFEELPTAEAVADDCKVAIKKSNLLSESEKQELIQKIQEALRQLRARVV